MGKLSVAMCVLALILFFLPWLDVNCQGPQGTQKMASQSGVQIIYGGLSMSQDMQQLRQMGGGDAPSETEEEGDKPGWSLLTGIAFLAVLGGALIGVAGILKDSSVKLNPKISGVVSSLGGSGIKPGTLAMVALVVLLLAVIIGFPVERSVKKQMQEQNAGSQQNDMPFQVGVDVNYRWPLHFELLVLAVPAFLMLNEKFKWVMPGGKAPASDGAPTTPPPPAT